MLAFAGNSILCRWALADTAIDPASFTAIRLVSGALCLAGLVFIFNPKFITNPTANDSLKPSGILHGSWLGALGLFTYAACFSFAYIWLNAATGALILFAVLRLCYRITQQLPAPQYN